MVSKMVTDRRKSSDSVQSAGSEYENNIVESIGRIFGSEAGANRSPQRRERQQMQLLYGWSFYSSETFFDSEFDGGAGPVLPVRLVLLFMKHLS